MTRPVATDPNLERSPVVLLDEAPEQDRFGAEVLAGLRKTPKTIPSKFFYDEEGSRLFDRITTLDVYYPTRAERAIMEAHVGEMVAVMGPRVLLVEYGSGSSIKTRILLDHLQDPAGYVPIDISREHLLRSASKLAEAYPRVRVMPVSADYTQRFTLPRVEPPPERTIVYFPGSTVGNFTPDEAVAFLRRMADVCGRGGGVLIGVDLKKDAEILQAAYDDPEGVTAAFNKNLLVRVNRELGGDFDVERFAHEAIYDEVRGRVEMRLVSLADQTARVKGVPFRFERDERIVTEFSYKYDVDGFARLAGRAGFRVDRVWTDADRLFSVQYLCVA